MPLILSRILPVLAMGLLCLLPPRARAAEYFVSLEGSDSHAGTTVEAAFRTIQRGVDALVPGDTLTIEPGEYHESVRRDGLGSADVETIIRARVRGTVVLRGDVPAPTFRKADGFRFIHVADYDGPVEGVIETSTPQNLQPSTTLAELEHTPGLWYHDTAAKKLYISTSDFQPALKHRYTVSVIGTHGLHLDEPERVVIDGIAATGFLNAQMLPSYPGYYCAWGIILSGARHCTIRNCTAYLNGGGIATHSSKNEGGHNLIDHCTAFGNYVLHSVETGNICCFASNHDVIANSYVYDARGNGIRHYGAGIRGPAVVRNTLAWGHGSTDYFLKGGPIAKFGLVENSVALGKLYSHNVSHNIIGTSNQYNREPGRDNIRYASEARSIADREFADPDNLDFRLQATSRFRGSGPEGSDRGPHPYRENIFYVSPEGSDDASGLSVRDAWQTLARGLEAVRPGDTLYLEPGTYAAPDSPLTLATKPGGATASIRGRGIEPVVITGPLRVSESSHLAFERLHFAGSVTVREGGAIAFRNCRFLGSATALAASAVEGLRVTHCEFTGFADAAIRAAQCEDMLLRGNLFDNGSNPALVIDRGEAVVYADYNGYRSPERAWRIGDAGAALSALAPAFERYGRAVAPQYQADARGVRLVNAFEQRGIGPLGSSIGLHHPYRPRELRLVGPVVHSLTPTTANIEWWTSRRATCEIAWGLTPACENTLTLDTEEFGNFSLTGLEPGRTYYFQVRAVSPRIESDQLLMQAVRPAAEPLVIQTPTTAAGPAVYYVAPDGDDGHSGLSREQAWRTVAHAGSRVLAGDTVLIAEGTYMETVHVRGSGDEGLPVTFKAIPGEKVVFDGNNRLLSIAFSVGRKASIHLDGLYFSNFGIKGWETIISLYDSSHIRITRCFMNNRGRGNPSHFLYINNGEDIEIANCVIANGMYGIYTRNVDNLRIENNVFYHNLITACTLRGSGDKGIHLRGNIFVDNHPGKARVALFELGGGIEIFHFRDNCFFLRHPDEERQALWFYGNGPGRLSVAAYEQQTGETGNVVQDPRLAFALGQAPTDRDGEPVAFLPDWLSRQRGIDFPDLFTTDPDLRERGIGLIPEAFADFHFHSSDSENQ